MRRGLDHAALSRWASEIAELNRIGKQVVLVSSGAIAEGLQRLAGKAGPKHCTNYGPPPQSGRWG